MPQILKFFYLLSFSSSFFVFQLSCSSHNAFSENQLEKESSPYLLQHAKNPVLGSPGKRMPIKSLIMKKNWLLSVLAIPVVIGATSWKRKLLRMAELRIL